MKNLWIIPTDKPSRLVKNSNENKLYLCIQTLSLDEEIYCNPQHIYITSDEKIEEGDWFMSDFNSFPIHNIKELSERAGHLGWTQKDLKNNLKIILTTDQDLIKDGVQAIDDDFLEWFVKNPSCEKVDVGSVLKVKKNGVQELMQKEYYKKFPEELPNCVFTNQYKIIIPKEEPKQTIQEYEQQGLEKHSFELEPKQERMYSEEDVKEMLFMALYEPKEECCTTHTKDSIVRKVLKTFKSD